MARYSKIDRRIWNDAKFRALSRSQPCGQLLFLYLLTNPRVGVIPGIYSAGEAELSEALGWELKGFREAFAEVSQQGLAKADFGTRLIWIPNAIRYNEPANPNQVRHWRDPWDETPECPLKREAWDALLIALRTKGNAWADPFLAVCPEPSPNGTAKGMPKGTAKGMPKGFAKGMPNQEQEQEQSQEQKPIITDGADFLAFAHELLDELRIPGTPLLRQTIARAMSLKMDEANSIKSDAQPVNEKQVYDWMLTRTREFLSNNAGTKSKSLLQFFSDGLYDDPATLSGQSLDELRLRAEARVGANNWSE